MYYTSFLSFLVGLDRRHDPPQDRPSSEMRSSTWWFFASSVWHCLWERWSFKPSSLSDKREPCSMKWMSNKLHNKSKPWQPAWKKWLVKMKSWGESQNPRMRNDSGSWRTRMKKNIGGSKETIMRKDRIARWNEQEDENARRKLVQNGEWASQHEEADGQTQEYGNRQSYGKLRWNDLQDRFTIHHRSIKPSIPTKVLSSPTRVLWRLQRSLGSHWVVQDFDAFTDDPDEVSQGVVWQAVLRHHCELWPA